MIGGGGAGKKNQGKTLKGLQGKISSEEEGEEKNSCKRKVQLRLK